MWAPKIMPEKLFCMLTAVINDYGCSIVFEVVNNIKRADVYSLNIVTSTTTGVSR